MNNEIVIKEGVHYIGTPCKNCGNTIKYISDRSCILCKKTRNKENVEYRKQRYKNKKEEVLQKSKCYYQDNKEHILENNRVRYQSNREERIEQIKQYQKDNPEKTKAKNQRRRAKKTKRRRFIYRSGMDRTVQPI